MQHGRGPQRRAKNTARPRPSQAGVADAVDTGALLSQAIAPHSELLTGRLPNGLQYVLLPNATPPARFEAHLEMHVGSVDEKADEQASPGGGGGAWGVGTRGRARRLGAGGSRRAPPARLRACARLGAGAAEPAGGLQLLGVCWGFAGGLRPRPARRCYRPRPNPEP